MEPTVCLIRHYLTCQTACSVSYTKHAQEIYLATFKYAYDEYKAPQREGQSPEEVVYKVAWSAVKHRYHKDENKRWVQNT
ncbi:MAG: cation transport regulator [Paraglaciecola sp.]|jgi:cation transport regulator